MSKVDIAGLKIDAITQDELLKQLVDRIRGGQKTWLTTPYSEFLHATLLNPEVMRILNSADIAVPDGIGLFWAKRFLDIPLTAKSYWGKILQAAWQIKYSLAAIIFYPRWIKSVLPEKITGSDLIWDLAKLGADNNLSVYLLGGFGDTAKLAAEKISKTNSNGRQILFSDKNPEDLSVVNEINKVAPDILLVAYGPIKQEKWIAENLPKLNVKLAVGLGGSFDYIAGKKSAPPKVVRNIGLEWLWRLFTQPYRVKRIFNATFGLAWALWHYKVFTSLPLRQNVAIIILNKQKEVLVSERNPKDFYIDIISTAENLKRQNYWQFPQGGIESGETIQEAAQREAQEETGIKNLQLFKISERTNTYLWNNTLRKFNKNKKYQNKGQTQHVAYFNFLGTPDEIKIDNIEFINYKWVAVPDLDKVIQAERTNLTKIVQEDLKDLA